MSFWTRLVDTITPWDRRGEVERRKKREEERQQQQNQQNQRQTQAPRSTQRTNFNIQTRQPDQTLGGQKFDIGIDINNRVQVPQKSEYDKTNGLEKPKQSFFDKVRDQFDANTEADKYRRLKGNIEKGENKQITLDNPGNIVSQTPVVGTATKMLNTLGKQIPQAFYTAKQALDTREYSQAVKSGDTERIRKASERLKNTNRLVDASNTGYEKNKGGLFNAGTLYNDEAARRGEFKTGVKEIGFPTAVAGLDLYTLGKGNAISEAIKQAGLKKGLQSQVGNISKATIGNYASGDLNARSQDASNKEAIKAGLLSSVFGLAPDILLPAAGRLLRNRFLPRPGTAVKELDDAAIKASVDNVIRETTPKPIAVSSNIPVSQAVDDGTPINVRNLTQRGKLIRETSNDAPGVRPVPTPDEALQQRAINKFLKQDFGVPDDRIEGVMPRAPERLFSLDEATVRTGQNKVIDDAADPDIQSLLSRGSRPEAEVGKPIRVKDVQSTPVRDETIIPQGLPEKPGTVRATAATDQTKVLTEAVASQPTPVSKPELSKTINNGLENGTKDIPIKDVTTENGGIPAQGDLSKAFEDIIKGLRESQKAYQEEKALTKAEQKRRFANYRRIYDEQRAAGKSSQEAEAMARKALGGKYTKNTVSNVEIDQPTRDLLFDKVSKAKDGLNIKKAFEHLFDANRSEPLRPGERTRIRRFIQNELGEEVAQSFDEAIVVADSVGERSFIGKIADEMTASIAAGDVSAVGRQGLSGLINHPVMWAKSVKEATKAMFDPQYYKTLTQKLVDDPDTAFIQEVMGGKYHLLDDVADEARGRDVGNKLTAWYVNPSNRHYNAFLDTLRHQQKKAIIESYGGQEGFLKAARAASPENPEKWARAWNRVVDTQSGRASFGSSGSPTVGDMQVLFSARNLASKFQRLTAPVQFGLLKKNPSAYLYQLKETAAQAAVLAGTLATIDKSGIADIENGKIKIGNTRIDITGGFSTIFKAANDLRKGMGVMHDNSEGGSFVRSGLDVVQDFLQNQLSPPLATIGKILGIDLSKGEDQYGNKIDAKWWFGAAPLPAVAQTVIDSATNGENLLDIARNVMLDAIGLNTNTYQSAEDKDNAARAKTADQVNTDFQKIMDTGLLNEKIIADIDDENIQKILSGQSNKQLSDKELRKIKAKLVEGVGTGTGPDSDSAYRERGEYSKDLAVLRLKKEMLEAEPNTKPSDLKALDIQIKRSELLENNSIPPELLEAYQNTSLTEWRDLEETDPDMYQELWYIDKLMAENGVSYKRGAFDKQKFYQKESKRGRGGSGSYNTKMSTDFGKLTGSAPNAPRVRDYETFSQSSGVVPKIKQTRPNIVYTIREGKV